MLRHRSRIATGLALRFAASLFLCASALTGCGEIAFKRGSGPDAFAADRRSCQRQNADPASVQACLAQAGWHVTDMDAGAPPAPAATMQTPPVPSSSPAAPPALTAQAIPVPGASPPPEPPPPPPSSTKPLVVGGWWKFGAGAADLHEAGDACVAKLGPANAPDAGYHTVTPALYACLRASGWHGMARP